VKESNAEPKTVQDQQKKVIAKHSRLIVPKDNTVKNHEIA